MAASGRLAILTYHFIADVVDDMRSDSITKDEFASQVAWLSRAFSIFTLAEAMEMWSNGCLPRRSLVLTFDDGYKNNYDLAAPILSYHKVSATFFIATAFLDGGAMWNDRVIECLRRCSQKALDLRAIGLGYHDISSVRLKVMAKDKILRMLKYSGNAARSEMVRGIEAIAGICLEDGLMMSRSNARELSQQGFELGAHTVTHPILAIEQDALSAREISESKATLRGLSKEEIVSFAYPNGKPDIDFDIRHKDMAREAGFSWAVSTEPGIVQAGSDKLSLPRVSPWHRSGWRQVLSILHMMRRYGD